MNNMVKRFFNKTFSLFSKKQGSILSAAGIIMMAVFLSRTLGLLRDRMLTARFSPQELGVYFAAFRLPNLIFELLVMGALSTAFIPVFSQYLSKNKKEEAFKMASSVINIGIVIFILLALPLLFFAPQISYLIAPGFSKEEILLMASFTRIIILAQVFPLIIGNFLTGILQSFNRFLIPALAPVTYNIGIILGIVFFSPLWGLYGPVWGVILGALFFMVIQIPFVVFLGYRHSLIFKHKQKEVREVGRLMLPRTLGLTVSQIGITIDLILASILGARAVAVFNFAQHLQQIPIGLFGAPIAQAALPSLTRFWTKQDKEEFKKIFLASFHQILFLVLPSSIILIVLRVPVVRLVFGAARFDWEATVMTGKTLAFFSLSLFAQSLIHLLARSFYALHDSKTPVIIGTFSILVNIVLSFLFIKVFFLPIHTLALSTSIASFLDCFLLLFFLDKKIGGFKKTDLFLPALKIFIASAITGVALYVPLKLLDQLVFDTTRTINLLALTGTASLSGLFCYIFLAWFLKIKEVTSFFHVVKKFGKVKKVFFETSREVLNGVEKKV